ncbi:hypothetical protein HYC85_028869 [Camellia sinensis]|uniref:V-type proton ATPase subunit C n=1 Tax=Camellia sinensis TaxID=4442 RepID=A0A7J7FYN2_CAMSI|nr:hypothetical protein HYC85_028869 [Camellia sinensis]
METLLTIPQTRCQSQTQKMRVEKYLSFHFFFLFLFFPFCCCFCFKQYIGSKELGLGSLRKERKEENRNTNNVENRYINTVKSKIVGYGYGQIPMQKLVRWFNLLKSNLQFTLMQKVFSSWMHFCAVRVFTESILRYGLPPSFLLSVVLAPSVKGEKKARSILEELCDSANSTYWKSKDGGMGGLGGDADAYPYNHFELNLEEFHKNSVLADVHTVQWASEKKKKKKEEVHIASKWDKVQDIEGAKTRYFIRC